MPPRLTPLRINLLRTIARLTQELGGPPSAAELARHLNQTEATLSYHLKVLAELGYVARQGARGRLQLTEQATALLPSGIPIYGRIAAGPPLMAEQVPDRMTPNLDTLMGVKEGDFLLEVQGESMIGLGLMSGDLVLVRPAAEVLDGEVAVVLLPGENVATLKRFYHMLDEVILESENPDIPRMTFPAEQVTIQGKMIGRLGLAAPPRKTWRR